MADKRPRIQREIRSNVENVETLLVVKRSIYPWDSLIPQADDDSSTPARNFFIDCADEEEARRLKSSIQSSGNNYYLKRKLGLIPIVLASRIGEGKDTVFGVLCTAVTDIG